MEALALFHQNFAVGESLVQLYQLFSGMNRSDISKELHLAICTHWKAPENSVLQHACNNHMQQAIDKLQSDIRTSQEQEEARRLAREAALREQPV